MKAQTLLKKAAAGLGTVALALAMSACSHHTTLAEGQTTGQIRTEQTSQVQSSSGEVIGTAPAPANAQGTTAASTPAVISGPAAVDSTGRVYTSSSVGSAGNASSTGLNTNVNIVPKPAESTVVVTTSPAPVVTTTTVETTPAPVVVETPAPAPVIVETPAPAPVVVETPAPMTSSTTETSTQTTTHRRMRKD